MREQPAKEEKSAEGGAGRKGDKQATEGRRADHWHHQEGTGAILESVLAWWGQSQHMGCGCMGREDLEKYIHTACRRVL